MVKFTFKLDNKATEKTVVEIEGDTLEISESFGSKIHADDCEYGLKVRLASVGRDSIQALKDTLSNLKYTLTENVHVEKADDTAKRVKALSHKQKEEFMRILAEMEKSD